MRMPKSGTPRRVVTDRGRLLSVAFAPDGKSLACSVGKDLKLYDLAADTPHVYAGAKRLSLNQWALSGSWTVGSDRITLDEPGGRIGYRFHARDLHLVMGPAGGPVRFRARIEGELAPSAYGGDVGPDGMGTLTDQRLYQLIRQPPPIVNRQSFKCIFCISLAKSTGA